MVRKIQKTIKYKLLDRGIKHTRLRELYGFGSEEGNAGCGRSNPTEDKAQERSPRDSNGNGRMSCQQWSTSAFLSDPPGEGGPVCRLEKGWGLPGGGPSPPLEHALLGAVVRGRVSAV